MVFDNLLEIQNIIRNSFKALLSTLPDIIVSQKQRLKTFSILVLINFFIMGVGFITRVKIANLLGKKDFGLFAFGLALGSFGGIIVRFGMDKTLVRDLIHKCQDFSNLILGSLIVRGIMFALAFLLAVMWKMSPLSGKDVPWAVVIIFTATCVISLDLQAVYDTLGAMERQAVYNLIRRCIYFASVWIIVLIQPQRLDLDFIAMVLLITSIVYLIVQFMWIKETIKIGPLKINKIALKSALQMSKKNTPIFLAALAGFFVTSFNQLALKHICGPSRLGEYAAAWTIVTLAIALLNQVSRIGSPVIAGITIEGIARTRKVRFIIKYTFVMVIVATSIAIPTLLYPKLLLQAIFKPEYVVAAPIVRIAGLYILLYSIAIITSQYIIAAHLEKLYFQNVVVGAFISVVVCIIFIKRYSAIGAALGLLIAHGVTICLNLRGMIEDIFSS